MTTYETFESRIRDGETIIMDGGTASEIRRRGVPLGELSWSAEPLITSPETVRSVHEDYIRAGAEIIITNTFSTGRATLEQAGLGDRTVELNRLAVKLAQEARDNVAADRPVVIAGSMSTFHPQGDPTVIPSFEAALADYQEQSSILAEAGVDLIVAEMLIRTVDIRASVEAAVATGLPTWAGLSVKSDGDELFLGLRTKRGNERLAEAVEAAEGASALFIMHTLIDDTAQGLRELGRLSSLPIVTCPHWLYHSLC
jgi:S-methylmethionine-dependent homocysteine/selenocysteine methylase